MNISIVNGTLISKEKIVDFLVQVDNEFPVPISHKCEIKSYINKILDFGEIICVNDNEKIVGLIGGYCNNSIEKKGYISILVLFADYRGKKLSKILLKKFILKCKNKMMTNIEVYTFNTNIEARGLYERFGFQLKSINDEGNCQYIKQL